MASFFGHPLGMVSYVTRFLLIFSAIIVLGITAWAVRGTKTLTVIYSLTISTVTIVAVILSLLIGCLLRRKTTHIFVILTTDAILSYLWLTSFIFLAQDFNRHSCRTDRWNGEIVCSRQYAAEAFSFIAFFATLVNLSLEIAYVHRPIATRVDSHENLHREQQISENLNAAGLA
ncbi:hypothetical protein N7520_000771 [Penicillium odoratum]|uniref:uncharacterized protein n=1 Tax=Penicillium odoratum TaxID=1167516 RepID=UPI002546664F|nr:uncharacterized protein N7520_000771 [Penicillium odoratum]KAJ5777525.1 hypothetical protein N7520_000771 [Penicillium odoratum]